VPAAATVSSHTRDVSSSQSTELLRVTAASGGFCQPMLETLTAVSMIRTVVSDGCLQQHGQYKQVTLK